MRAALSRCTLLLLWLTLAATPASAQLAPPALPGGAPAPPADEQKELDAAFLVEEPLLDATTIAPRASADAYARLQRVAAARPQSAIAQAYLALAAERAGAFAEAEAAWRRAVNLSGAAPWALWGLAEHLARRARPEAELAALADLERAYAAAPHADAADTPAALDALHTRAIAVIDAHALAAPGGTWAAERRRHRRALVDLHPEGGVWLRRWVDELLAAGDAPAARAEVERFWKEHPDETRAALRLLAELDWRAGTPDAAIARYRKLVGADPLAPDVAGRVADFDELLQGTGRAAAERARLEERLRAGTLTLGETVILFHLYQHAGEPERARELLRDGRARAPRSHAETLLYARLLVAAGDLPGAVRLYHAVAAAGPPALAEQAFVELGALLLRDDLPAIGLTPLDPVDAFDPQRLATGPSIPGGLASFLFEPYRFSPLGAGLRRLSAAWQNGARADALYGLAAARFPASTRVAELGLALLAHHETWARPRAVLALADAWLAAWPKARAAWRVETARARAHRALGDVAASDKAYAAAIARAAPHGADAQPTAQWVRVLAAEKRHTDAVALLWRAVDRAPGAPERWQALVQYVVDTRMFDEELAVYERALKQLGGSDWAVRLARHQLRHRGEKAYRDFVVGLAGSLAAPDLAAALAELAPLDWEELRRARKTGVEAFYRAALARFPYHLGFVHGLLAIYDADPARAADARALVLRYALLDPGLGRRAVEELARAGVAPERLATPRGRAERLFHAELLVWMSRHDEALPEVLALRKEWPHDRGLARLAAALTLGASDSPRDLATARAAVAHHDAMRATYPTEPEWLDAPAAVLAEAGDLDAARARWKALAGLRRGDPAGLLAVAAATWDYYLFDEAEGAIADARRVAGDPLLYWDRLGAIAESRRDVPAAAAIYAGAYLDQLEGELAASAAAEGRWTWSDAYGDGYDDGWGRPLAHGAEATPGEKLAALEARAGGPEAVRKAFAALATARPKDFRPVLAWSRWQGERGDGAGRTATLTAAIERFDDGAFLALAADEAATLGAPALRVRALERRATLGKRAPALLWPLAQALADAKRPADAEKVAREAVDRTARGKKAPDPAVADAWARLADLLAALGQPRAALAALGAGADWLAGEARDERLLDLGLRHAAAGDAPAASALFRELAARRPLDPRPIDGLGAVAERARDPKALAAAYQEGLRAVDAAKLGPDERRARARALRLLWIARAERLGLHTDAMDQWILVVEADPDERALVAQAVEYGQRHGALARFETHFAAAADRSHKDVRWPLVLAWTAEQTGRPAEAARRYRGALAVRPDRLELHEALAANLSAAGDHAGAEAAYAELWRLADEDERWLLPRARELIALGRDAGAAAVIDDWLAATTWSGPARHDAPAALWERRGAWAPALALRERALAELVASPDAGWLSAPFFTQMLADGLRAGRGRQTALALERARAGFARAHEATGSPTAQAMVLALDEALGPRLFDLVAAEALDADATELWPVCVATARRIGPDAVAALGERADAAGFPELAAPLYDEQRRRTDLDSWERDRFTARLVNLYAARGADRALLARFEADAGLRTVELLPLAAAAARRLGDGDRELVVLTRLWDAAGARPGSWQTWRHPLVARYLELLVARGDRAALARVATRGGAGAGQVIDWLWAHGERDLAEKAMAATAGVLDLPGRWLAAQTAIALDATAPDDPRIDRLYLAALGHRTIGETLADPAHAQAGQDDAYVGGRFAALAMRFGARIAARKPKKIALADWAFAAAELRPRSPDAQVAAGELWLRAADPARARRHFQLALALAPRHLPALDGLARAELAAGDRAAAFAAWDRIRAVGTDEAAVYHAEALERAGFRAEGRTALAEHVARRWKDLDASSGPPLVHALADRYLPDERGAGGPLDRTLAALVAAPGETRAWPSEAVLGLSFTYTYSWGAPDGLEWSAGGRDGDDFARALVADDALEPYLDAALAAATARAEPAAVAHAERALVVWLVAHRRFDRAAARLDARRARAAAASTAPPPAWIVLTEAEIELGRGDWRAAEARLTARVTLTLDPAEARAAAALLERHGQRQGAARLTVAFATRRVQPGWPVVADALVLADAYLTLADVPAAERVLAAAAAPRPEDVTVPLAAAALYEAHGAPRDALRWRLRARELAPRDGRNRLALARDFAALGQGRPALEIAALLLGDRDADRATRAAAATFVAGLARDPALARPALEAVAARAAQRPFDEATFAALAACARASGDDAAARAALERGEREAFAPGLVPLERGEAALAAGRPADAEPAFERALLGLSGARPARLGLFAARRARGHHAAAVGALDTGALDAWRDAGPEQHGAARRARALGAGLAELGPERGPAARSFVAAAADSAEQAGDPLAAAYFFALGAELAPDAESKRALAARAEKALAAASAAADRDERHLVDLQEVF